MTKRPLGKSGISVAPFSFGGNVFGWTIDEATSFTLLDAFVDAGFDLIDTADVYSNWKLGNLGGESETIIGKWLRKTGKRSKIVLATKVGMKMSDDKRGLKKEYILREVEDSLKRLQTDHIDLYQSHTDDLETPVEETLSAYATLVKQGKVRAIGASNFTAERLAESLKTSEANGFPAYQTLQPLYNLYDREVFEKSLEPFCLKHGIGVIGYSSLASGFLTGKYRTDSDLSKSLRGPRAQTRMNERGMRILAALDQVAGELHSTPGSVALAWLIARPSVTAPIASATSLSQLRELINATALKLEPEQISSLNQASS